MSHPAVTLAALALLAAAVLVLTGTRPLPRRGPLLAVTLLVALAVAAALLVPPAGASCLIEPCDDVRVPPAARYLHDGQRWRLHVDHAPADSYAIVAGHLFNLDRGAPAVAQLPPAVELLTLDGTDAGRRTTLAAAAPVRVWLPLVR